MAPTPSIAASLQMERSSIRHRWPARRDAVRMACRHYSHPPFLKPADQIARYCPLPSDTAKIMLGIKYCVCQSMNKGVCLPRNSNERQSFS
jgi:hypothetical protein